MNSHGVHYIRTLPFAQRLAYAQAIKELGHRRALVVSASVWFDNEYKCLIAHTNHRLQDLLTCIDMPLHGVAAFDAITKTNLNLDMKVEDLDEKDDGTRYIHLVLM